MGMSEARCGRCDGVGSPTKGPKSQQSYEVVKKKPNGNNGHAKPDFGGEGGAPLASKRQERQSGHPWNNRYRRTTRLRPDFKITAVLAGVAPHQGPKKSTIVRTC